MSRSIRFLGLAVLAWAGVRAISLGLVPGTGALAFDLPAGGAFRRPDLVPPLQPTLLPSIQPLGLASQPASAAPAPPAFGPIPIYVSVTTQAPRIQLPEVKYVIPDLTVPVRSQASAEPEVTGQLAEMEIGPVPPPRAIQQTPGVAELQASGSFDRLQLSSWAMMRQDRGDPRPVNAATLGGSQAGARLLWFIDPRLAASLRTSSPVNSQRGGEAALGVRYQPLLSVPVAVSVERRQAFGRLGGRSGFAAYLEGGVYDRTLPQGLKLDYYFQGGAIGPRHRLWFVDGSAAVSHPVWRNISAGVGIWGGAQPSLARLDAGPRISVRVGRRIQVHGDYRRKVVGNAEPGSGGVLTVAGDF